MTATFEKIGRASHIRLGKPLDRAELGAIEQHLHLHYNKWDTQVGDVSVLSEQPLVLSGTEWDSLSRFAERLAAETASLESEIRESPRFRSRIGAPKLIWDSLAAQREPNAPGKPGIARVMRFDFHPTESGWSVSEINSDVPGGWSEGATLPLLYQPFYKELDCPPSPLKAWGGAIETLVGDGHVALLNAPGYMEDEQVIHSFIRELRSRRIPSTSTQTPSAFHWPPGEGCVLRNNNRRVSAVIRFYQAEWLCALPRNTGWAELLKTAEIPVVNPAISAISESKRFPLVFNDVPECSAWRALMPECRDPRDVDSADWDRWVLKACYSNTGDQVYICSTLSHDEKQKVIRKARRNPYQWVAQKRFETKPIQSCRGLLHPCVGVFVVNGSASGAYVRLASGQITNGSAVEAPLLIDRAAG